MKDVLGGSCIYHTIDDVWLFYRKRKHVSLKRNVVAKHFNVDAFGPIAFIGADFKSLQGTQLAILKRIVRSVKLRSSRTSQASAPE